MELHNTNITNLDLRNCKSLENVDGLSKLKNIKKLDLRNCSNIQNLDGIGNLTNLTEIGFSQL